MNPYFKAALFLIRLIAAGFCILSLTLLSSDVFLMLSHRPISGRTSLAFKVLPLLIGLALYLKSFALAKRLTKDFDE
jgi:uncharacterized membrane protein